MRRLTHLLVLAAFVFSCGGQWYVLQAVAWANMIRDYAQVVPLDRAVEMTFSGQYPCEICKAIAEKQQQEHDKLLTVDKYEKKFFPPLSLAPRAPSFTDAFYPELLVSLRSRAEAPPTPPPRLA